MAYPFRKDFDPFKDPSPAELEMMHDLSRSDPFDPVLVESPAELFGFSASPIIAKTDTTKSPTRNRIARSMD